MRRPKLEEIALTAAITALGAVGTFLMDWGSVKQAIAQHTADASIHGSREAGETRDAGLERQLDSLDKRLDTFQDRQEEVNRRIVGALGRIEGRLGTAPQPNRGE